VSIALLVMWLWMHGQTERRTLDFTDVLVAAQSEPRTTIAPQDVPAVMEKRIITSRIPVCWDWRQSDINTRALVYGDGYREFDADRFTWERYRNLPDCTPENKHARVSWICSDKSRILLTAEDGTKHCIKFGGVK